MNSFLDEQFPSVGSTFAESFKRYKRNSEKRFSFGNPFLDDALGGICPNDLILLGAPTGAGKTTQGVSIAVSAAKQGKRVVYFALEADRGEIDVRIAQQEGIVNCSMRDIRMGRMNPEINLNAMKDFQNLRVFSQTTGTFGPEQVKAAISNTESTTDFYVIDHFHMIETDPRNSEIGEHKALMRKIRNLALGADKPVLVIAHFNKAYGRGDTWLPRLHDFYGTGDLVNLCTSVVLISNKVPEEFEAKNLDTSPTTFYAAKFRADGSVARFPGILSFNHRSGKYLDGYVLWDLVKKAPTTEFPVWATRARKPVHRPYSTR